MIDWDAKVIGPCVSAAVFGEDVQPTYSPARGAPFPIDGVFDRAYKELILLDGDSGADILTPVLGVRLAQFPAPPAKNDRVYVASVGITYIVKDVHPDGHGAAKLLLSKAGVQ